MLTYANIQDRIEQFLQDTSNATYDTTELGMWIEEGLKEFSTYIPHIVEVVFQVESRTGRETAGTANTLTDTTESQFLSTDDDNEKVIHNTTDYTWAVVKTASASTSVLTLTASIMAINDAYEMYNKRCWNERQIYIGDVTDYLWIDSVEYPIGTKRNWRIYDDVLEIDVDWVADSDTTQTSLPNVDVLVRFAKPHKLCQLTDLKGEVHTAGTAGDTTMQIKSFFDTDIVEIGDEFYIVGHRNLYTITTGVTLAYQTAAGSEIGFYPPLEAAASADMVINFTKSTLQPQHENTLYRLISSIAIRSDALRHINAIPKGGQGTWSNYVTAAQMEYSKAISDIPNVPKTKKRYSTGFSYLRSR